MAFLDEFDPARDASQTHIDEKLAEADFHARLTAITDSPTWQAIVEVLAVRREQLFSSRPATNEEMWLREGALREVHALLHQGPTLIVNAYDHQRRM